MTPFKKKTSKSVVIVLMFLITSSYGFLQNNREELRSEVNKRRDARLQDRRDTRLQDRRDTRLQNRRDDISFRTLNFGQQITEKDTVLDNLFDRRSFRTGPLSRDRQANENDRRNIPDTSRHSREENIRDVARDRRETITERRVRSVTREHHLNNRDANNNLKSTTADNVFNILDRRSSRNEPLSRDRQVEENDRRSISNTDRRSREDNTREAIRDRRLAINERSDDNSIAKARNLNNFLNILDRRNSRTESISRGTRNEDNDQIRTRRSKENIQAVRDRRQSTERRDRSLETAATREYRFDRRDTNLHVTPRNNIFDRRSFRVEPLSREASVEENDRRLIRDTNRRTRFNTQEATTTRRQTAERLDRSLEMEASPDRRLDRDAGIHSRREHSSASVRQNQDFRRSTIRENRQIRSDSTPSIDSSLTQERGRDMRDLRYSRREHFEGRREFFIRRLRYITRESRNDRHDMSDRRASDSRREESMRTSRFDPNDSRLRRLRIRDIRYRNSRMLSSFDSARSLNRDDEAINMRDRLSRSPASRDTSEEKQSERDRRENIRDLLRRDTARLVRNQELRHSRRTFRLTRESNERRFGPNILSRRENYNEQQLPENDRRVRITLHSKFRQNERDNSSENDRSRTIDRTTREPSNKSDNIVPTSLQNIRERENVRELSERSLDLLLNTRSVKQSLSSTDYEYNTVRSVDVTRKLRDEAEISSGLDTWANTIKIMLCVYLIGQIFVNSSNKNKMRFQSVISPMGFIKEKVQ